MAVPEQLDIPAVKDEERPHPVASAWRPALADVVRALARGDYMNAGSVPSVSPLSKDAAEQMKAYIAGYGETLADLPEDAWASSVAQWMGTHWDLFVDLWTVESGPSDMVLSARVVESEGGFQIQLGLVYVP